MKHNKKRNTAILFEILIRELTKAITVNNQKNKKIILDVIKEHFGKRKILSKELQYYNTLNETTGVGRNIAEKILLETKVLRASLNDKKIFEAQGRLVSKINKLPSKDKFSAFIPNYKNLASISQIFNIELPIKNRILLEQEIIEKMVNNEANKENMVPVDNLTYMTFVKKFNSKYSIFLNEQRVLLNRYVASFGDNGLELKTFLNEEVARLAQVLAKALKTKEALEDSNMHESIKGVLGIMKGFKEKKIDSEMVRTVLKVQNLAKEITSNG